MGLGRDSKQPPGTLRYHLCARGEGGITCEVGINQVGCFECMGTPAPCIALSRKCLALLTCNPPLSPRQIRIITEENLPTCPSKMPAPWAQQSLLQSSVNLHLWDLSPRALSTWVHTGTLPGTLRVCLHVYRCVCQPVCQPACPPGYLSVCTPGCPPLPD